jgi:hypothetical protein
MAWHMEITSSMMEWKVAVLWRVVLGFGFGVLQWRIFNRLASSQRFAFAASPLKPEKQGPCGWSVCL